MTQKQWPFRNPKQDQPRAVDRQKERKNDERNTSSGSAWARRDPCTAPVKDFWQGFQQHADNKNHHPVYRQAHRTRVFHSYLRLNDDPDGVLTTQEVIDDDDLVLVLLVILEETANLVQAVDRELLDIVEILELRIV